MCLGPSHVVLAALLPFTSACVSASELCVRVTDESSQPLPAAQVVVRELKTGMAREEMKTDPQGKACASNTPEGPYSVEASLEGFLHGLYFPVSVTYSRPSLVVIRLPLGDVMEDTVSRNVTVSGSLFYKGVPVRYANICLRGIKDGYVSCTKSNDLGEYAFLIPAGLYELNLTLPDGSPRSTRLDFSTPGAVYRNAIRVSDMPAKSR